MGTETELSLTHFFLKNKESHFKNPKCFLGPSSLGNSLKSTIVKFLLSFHSLKKCNALENVHLAILKDFPRVLCNKSWSKKFTTAYKLFSICAIHFSHTRYEFAIAYVLYIPPQRNITYIHCNIIGHSKLVHDQVNTKFLNGGNVYDTFTHVFWKIMVYYIYRACYYFLDITYRENIVRLARDYFYNKYMPNIFGGTRCGYKSIVRIR